MVTLHPLNLVLSYVSASHSILMFLMMLNNTTARKLIAGWSGFG